MDFIRKNWSRLSLALLFLLGGILGIVAWSNSGYFKYEVDNYTRFYSIVLLIATLLYFFGMTCVTVLKCVAGKKAVSISYMVIGGIITVLELVMLCVCVNQAELISLTGANSVTVFCQFIVPTMVFGFYPLIKGVTRFIEAEQVPAKAKTSATEAAPAEKKAAK